MMAMPVMIIDDDNICDYIIDAWWQWYWQWLMSLMMAMSIIIADNDIDYDGSGRWLMMWWMIDGQVLVMFIFLTCYSMVIITWCWWEWWWFMLSMMFYLLLWRLVHGLGSLSDQYSSDTTMALLQTATLQAEEEAEVQYSMLHVHYHV